MDYHNYNKILPFRYFYYMKKNKLIEYNEKQRYKCYLKDDINLNLNIIYNIKELCKIRKNYIYTYNVYKKYFYILKNFPDDIIEYISLYDIQPTCNNIIVPYYNILHKKIDNSKLWYILISNILFTIKKEYHENVLDICKNIKYTNLFDVDIDNIFLKLGYISNIITNGILFDTFHIYEENIIEKCKKYKNNIKNIIYPTYKILVKYNNINY